MILGSYNKLPFALAALASLSSCAVLGASVDRRASNCNGHNEFCDRSYGNITFVGAHDSYAVGTDNLSTNQDYNVTQQLTDGIRMLQMQAHSQNGGISLCHTSCALYNGGTFGDYLKNVSAWMQSNPNDVVTLLIVNSDKIAPSQFASAYQSAGLDKMSYTPTSSPMPLAQWPTLGSMIDAGTRLVTFMDTGADSSVPYIIDEFTNMWETAFDVTDTTFDCNINRTQGATTQNSLFLINHFLDKLILGNPAPDVDQANTTNAATGVGSLGTQVQTCASTQGRNPNFMLVDFYEYGGGSVFQVAADANGVSYSPSTPIATPKSQSSSSSSGTPNSSISTFTVHGSLWTAAVSLAVGLSCGALSVL